MSKESGLIIGSVIFAVLGVIAAIVFYIYIGMKSPQQAVAANRKYPNLYAGSVSCLSSSLQSACGSCGPAPTCTKWIPSFSLCSVPKKSDLQSASNLYPNTDCYNHKSTSKHPSLWFLLSITVRGCIPLHCFLELINLPQKLGANLLTWGQIGQLLFINLFLHEQV